MMQLICNGEFLDLKEGTRFTLKKVNPLFAFDRLTCERTTEFEIPDTAKNDRIFSLSKIPAFDGEGMRRRYPAQLQNGVCVKDGYLYVSSYSKGAYRAIFVTGELVGLQAIRNLGKLRDIIKNAETVEYGATPISPGAASLVPWANVRYLRKAGTIHPSMRVGTISNRVVAQNDLLPVTLPAMMDGLRIIPAKINGIGKTDATLSSTIIDPGQPTSEEPQTPFNTPAISGDASAVFTTVSHIVSTMRLNVQLLYKYAQLAPRQNIRLIIPDDWPEDRYIISFEDDYQDATFLGGRSFTKVWDQPSGRAILTRTGEPLAGRTVDIPRGTPFSFVTEGEYDCSRVFFQQALYTIGWHFNSYNYNITFEGNPVEVGDAVRMQDNLPDITYVQLLKTIAAISGRALNYTDADGIMFEEVNFETWPTIDVTGDVIKESNIARRFSDYARSNVIRFDSGALPVSKVTISYTVDNDNLEEEKDLQVIPFSEGGAQYDGSGNAVLYIHADEDTESDKDVIAQSGSLSSLLQVGLVKNEGIQDLCNASTCMTIDVRMSMHQYEQVTPKTAILHAGTRYVWTESTWGDGLATFTLAKI